MEEKQLYERTLADGLRISTYLDSKFKSNQLSVHLMLPLLPQTASAVALLSCLLPKSCAAYPTLGAFSQQQNMLYGAVVDGQVSKFGDNLLLTLYARGVDDAFVPGKEPITRRLAELLCEVLLAPCVQEGAFLPDSFLLEQQYLMDTILGEINDKRAFAVQQATQLMLAGEMAGYPRFGTVESAKALTAQEVYETYQNLLQTAPILVQLTGTGHLEDAALVFEEKLGSLKRGEIYQPRRTVHAFNGKVKEIVDPKDTKQSKLVLGFAMGDYSDKSAAVRVFNSLLSASPNSRFFMNVREKHSLCYYCAAAFHRRPGICLVDSGIRAVDKDKATHAILNEIQSVASGQATQNELEIAKRYLTDQFDSVPDQLAALAVWNLSCLLGESRPLAEEKAAVEQVTLADMADLAGRMQLDTVYFLKGEE